MTAEIASLSLLPLSLVLLNLENHASLRILILSSRALLLLGVKGFDLRMLGALAMEACALMAVGWAFGRSILL